MLRNHLSFLRITVYLFYARSILNGQESDFPIPRLDYPIPVRGPRHLRLTVCYFFFLLPVESLKSFHILA